MWPIRPALLLVLVSVAGVFGLSSCSSPKATGLTAAEPIILPRGAGGSATSDEVDPDLEDRLRGRISRARMLMMEVRVREALAVLSDALPDSRPFPDLRKEILALRRKCKKRLYDEILLDTSVSSLSPVVEVGEPIRLRVSFRNRSDSIITIPAQVSAGGIFSAKSTPTSIRVQWDSAEVDSQGSRMIREWDERRALSEDLVIPSGGSTELEMDLATLGDAFVPDRLVYRRVRLALTLPAARIDHGEDQVLQALTLGTVEVEVFPKNFGRIRDDARRFLTDALTTKRSHESAPTLILMAAPLYAQEDRNSCLDLLFEGKADPGAPPGVILAIEAARRIVLSPPLIVGDGGTDASKTPDGPPEE